MAWSASRPGLLLVTLTLTIALAAGCIDADTDVDIPAGPGPFVDPMAFVDGHDHADYTQHQMSWNLTELGYTHMEPELSVAWGELDIKTYGERDMAVVAFAWPTAGFATVDVTDPANPTLLDVFDTGYGYGADVKWIESGDFAVLAVQTHSTRLPSPLLDPVALTVENGLVVFHITPEGIIHDIGSSTPHPTAGVHMVYTQVLSGAEYVFAAYNTGGVTVFRFEYFDPPIGARLVPVNALFLSDFGPGDPTGAIPTGAHDMTVIHDDLLDRDLLWVAGGYLGLLVFDVTDPEDPLWPDQPLGSWIDPENTWYMHTVQSSVIGERRYVVLAPEVFSQAEIEVVAPLWILDGTDLGNMKVLATWKNPGDHGAEQLRFSVHNFQLQGNKIALAHYHGGVWLLEFRHSEAGFGLETVGYHLPARDPGRAMSGIYHGVYNMEDGPTIWDVAIHDGVIWASDVNSGLYGIGTPAWEPGNEAIHSLG